MLKNIGLIFWLIFCIIFLFFAGIFHFLYAKSESWFLFPYPWDSIEFAWEIIDLSLDENYLTQERFDKEYLIVTNNLYQSYLYVKRYELFIPHIEDVLEEYDIPNDFKYLPIAESALRNNVVSSAWAAGIWQFMPETARQYGLRVDDEVDERYNFEKSTIAAAQHLSYLYGLFDDWSLVAAAYNRWENWLLRDMESQGVDSYYDLYLNEETSRYVFRILAIKYFFQAYYQHKDFVDKIIWWVFEKPQVSVLSISEIEDISAWCSQRNISLLEFKSLNPWILGNNLPSWDWLITILEQ